MTTHFSRKSYEDYSPEEKGVYVKSSSGSGVGQGLFRQQQAHGDNDDHTAASKVHSYVRGTADLAGIDEGKEVFEEYYVDRTDFLDE